MTSVTRSRRCSAQSKAERFRHSEDGVEAGVTGVAQGFVQALTAQACVASQLRHTLRSRDIAECARDACRVVSNGSVIALVLWYSARQLAVGLSLSAVLSLAVLVVISQGFSIGAGELALLGVLVVAVISATVLLSVYISVWSAIRLDPSSALRHG